jgi:hypothetical protein
VAAAVVFLSTLGERVLSPFKGERNRGLKPTATFISSLRDDGLRFMESPHGVHAAHWDMNLPGAYS